MIHTILFSLFTIYKLSQGVILPPHAKPPPGQAWGAFGQFCAVPVAGQVQCETTTDIARHNTAGILDCSRINDCCLCESMECGSATEPCNSVNVGRNAALGVKSINIIGDSAAGGASVECMGDAACANTQIGAVSVAEVSCAGEYACYGAKMKLINPAAGFSIECAATGSCEGLQVEIFIPPPAAGAICDPVKQDFLLGAIECAGTASCLNLVFMIHNRGCDTAVIEMISCPDGACNGAMFGFVGDVRIGQCVLPATGPQPFGLNDARCFGNLFELTCQGTHCQNQIRTLSDPLDNFELACENPNSCLNSQYNVEISALERPQPVKNLNVFCAAEACKNVIFAVTNANVEPVNVGVECSAEGACDGCTFYGSNGVTFEVLCIDPLFCVGCTFNGEACNPAVPQPQVANGPQVVV